MNQEELRLLEAREKHVPWRKWGPYLSERQWGTVREDYSENGNAWDYFTHDMARSRAYRWGEDGLAGFSDEKQRLCFSVALWNGVDPIIKERLFGLTNAEGNHGEDVKEYYFYLDSTPTHSYMKYLYKYPQSAYPYDTIVQTNRKLTRNDLEYELLDTGVFQQDRYFDVFVEYAKGSPEDILIRITIWNRGTESAKLHLLPTLWFRNNWSWQKDVLRPLLEQTNTPQAAVIQAVDPVIGEYFLYGEANVPVLFTENETNSKRIWGTPNRTPYVKDGINNYLVQGKTDTINPGKFGTKASLHYQLEIGPGQFQAIKLRLCNTDPVKFKNENPVGVNFEGILKLRKKEADEFYASITPSNLSEDERQVMRQALAGMLWGKQYYYFNLDNWLEDHGAHPLLSVRGSKIRNFNWFHMVNDDVISMPDKWEYPWYAAWDLAFHTVSLAMVDLDFAKQQLDLMLRELYLHPSGQIPAYEWNFGDVNPPVHAWATLFVYHTEKQIRGKADLNFLKHSFQKLLMNFTWWVNRKDPSGKNVFEGGFLGLDNVGVFDRSAPLPTGGYLEQADGTAWMAFFSQNMLDISLELSRFDAAYEEMALKFVEHFLWIAAAMDRIGENQDELWDEEDGFFYDLLRFPDGSATRLKVRSIVGLLPLCAVSVFEDGNRFPRVAERVRRFVDLHPDLVANIAPPGRPGVEGRHILSILDEKKLRRVLKRMLDEKEFLSPHGIRALSRYHLDYPFVFNVHGEEYRVDYLPAESNTGMFGGNSNWRGPVWFPVNALIFRALLVLYSYYGNEFTVECPSGSGNQMNLFQVASELANRLSNIFLRDQNGHRPVYGANEKFQTDPHWREYILFHEYFNGDNGAGLGASHQTGWTGLVAKLIQFQGWKTGDHMLKDGARSVLNFPG